MNIDALTRILDTKFNGRVWQVATAPFDGSMPLAGFHVQPHPGQTVPAEADVLAFEQDDTDRQAATSAAQAGMEYRRARKAAYVAELGLEPDVINTNGDVLDVIFEQIATITIPGTRTPKFAAMLDKIAAIKARHPKP